MTQTSLFDICERKHQGNKHSAAANKRLLIHKLSARERVRIFIAGTDYVGATLPEIAQALTHPTAFPPRHYYPNELSGRCSELAAAGEIFKSGRSRCGAEVLVVKREWVNG